MVLTCHMGKLDFTSKCHNKPVNLWLTKLLNTGKRYLNRTRTGYNAHLKKWGFSHLVFKSEEYLYLFDILLLGWLVAQKIGTGPNPWHLSWKKDFCKWDSVKDLERSSLSRIIQLGSKYNLIDRQVREALTQTQRSIQRKEEEAMRPQRRILEWCGQKEDGRSRKCFLL